MYYVLPIKHYTQTYEYTGDDEVVPTCLNCDDKIEDGTLIFVEVLHLYKDSALLQVTTWIWHLSCYMKNISIN